MRSINSKLLLEPYESDGSIQTTISNGFATVKQKSTLVPLKAVADGYLYHRDGSVLKNVSKGDLVYFKEEDLHSQSWAKTLFTAQGSGVQFIIAESSLVIMVQDGSK